MILFPYTVAERRSGLCIWFLFTSHRSCPHTWLVLWISNRPERGQRTELKSLAFSTEWPTQLWEEGGLLNRGTPKITGLLGNASQFWQAGSILEKMGEVGIERREAWGRREMKSGGGRRSCGIRESRMSVSTGTSGLQAAICSTGRIWFSCEL